MSNHRPQARKSRVPHWMVVTEWPVLWQAVFYTVVVLGGLAACSALGIKFS